MGYLEMLNVDGVVMVAGHLPIRNDREFHRWMHLGGKT